MIRFIMSFIILLFFLIACNEKKINLDNTYIINSFPQTENLIGKSFGPIDRFLATARLELFDSIMAIVTPMDENQIHFVNLKGEYLKGFGKKGKGPGEFLTVWSIFRFPENNDICVFDITQQRITKLNIDSVLNEKDYFSQSIIHLPKSNFIFRLMPISDNRLILSFDGLEKRFGNLDLKTNSIDAMFGEYPVETLQGMFSDFLNKNDFPLIFQGNLCKIPSKSEMLVSYNSTDRLDIYNLDGFRVKTILGPNNDKLKYDNNGNKMVVSLSNISGYVSIFASENYIYGLYSGQPKAQRETYAFGKDFFVFNLEGNPISNFKLDKYLIDFVILGDSLLYGLEPFSNQPLVMYNLN